MFVGAPWLAWGVNLVRTSASRCSTSTWGFRIPSIGLADELGEQPGAHQRGLPEPEAPGPLQHMQPDPAAPLAGEPVRGPCAQLIATAVELPGVALLVERELGDQLHAVGVLAPAVWFFYGKAPGEAPLP